MFEEMLRVARRLDGMKVSVSVGGETDQDGYIDRQCPATDCEFSFKVHADDWRDKVSDDGVHCAFCGHTADSQQWFTHEQVEHAKKEALAKVKGVLGQAMRTDAQRWNQSQRRNSFLKITMNVSSQPREILLPAEATDPMRLKITCSVCGCRYAVIGSAFFCPACGHNDAEQVFRQSMTAIRSTLDALPLVRQGIADADTAEDTVRLLIESGLQNAITAFQRFAEALYLHHPAAPKARRNVFQNLAEGDALWAMAYDHGYDKHLSDSELASLSRYFQQRHLLAHKEGLVDDDYVARSGDTTYCSGQRVVVREAAVRECAQLIETLAVGMKRDVGRGGEPLRPISGAEEEPF